MLAAARRGRRCRPAAPARSGRRPQPAPPPRPAPRTGAPPPAQRPGLRTPRESAPQRTRRAQPAPDPGAPQVPQRSDRETPRLHFRPPDSASADRQAARRWWRRRPARGASGPRAGRAAGEGPRAGVAQPGRAAGPALAATASTSSSWSTTSSTRSRASSAREDPNLLSPMAIRLVRLSSNLRPEFARTLEARLIARLINATRRQDRDVHRVHGAALARGGRQLDPDAGRGQRRTTCGASARRPASRRSWTSTSPTAPTPNVIWMEAIVFRASDGGVVWSDAYRSDGTMTALLRTGQPHPHPRRAGRRAGTEDRQRAPATATRCRWAWRRWATRAPTGDIAGAQVSLRFHEKFGENQSSLFGMTAGIFTTGPPSANKQPQALNSILLGAYYSYDLSPPNLNQPEVWVYGEGGGMFSGQRGEHVLSGERPRPAPQVAAVAAGGPHVRLPHQVLGLRSGRRGLPAARGDELVNDSWRRMLRS